MYSWTMSENKSKLRWGIDHIGVRCGWVVHDGHGRVLMMKRGPKARDEHGAWEFGGGAVEFGESIDEAVRRELLEELGVKEADIEFLAFRDIHRKTPGGQPMHSISLIHGVKVDPKAPKIGEPEAISEIGWFTKDTLPTPLHILANKTLDVALKHGLLR